MKHAGAAALDCLAPLLDALRKQPQLRERGRGIFYQSGRARLHFHEDPLGLFADLRAGTEWLRFDVTGESGRADLLRHQGGDPKLQRQLGAASRGKRHSL